jgi:DNA polymerase elongation subunit (family B)
VAELFNTDLSPVQQYLFMKLKIEPTSKVEVQYDKNESRLIKITKINDDDELAAAPPPFSMMHFEIHTASSSCNLGPRDVDDPITGIRARYQQEPEISFEGSEDSILKEFSENVLAKDPDILISSNQHSRTTTLILILEETRRPISQTRLKEGYVSTTSRFRAIWTWWA